MLQLLMSFGPELAQCVDLVEKVATYDPAVRNEDGSIAASRAPDLVVGSWPRTLAFDVANR